MPWFAFVWRIGQHIRRPSLAVALACVMGLSVPMLMAKERKGGAPPPPAEAPKAWPALPGDLNLASLRVSAIDVLYQFDFSTEQLGVLQAAAGGSASVQARQAAQPNAKLADALNGFQEALLSGKEDAEVTKLRNQLIDLMDDPSGHLDDEVHPTDAARAKAPAIFKQLRASQIAAYLAGHGHEVADPEEVLMDVLDDLRDFQADKTAHPADEVNSLIEETASDVGYLVGGLDDAKAKSIASQANAWLKSVYEMSDADFTAKRAALPLAAQKIVGDVDAMQVIGNWLQRQLATLLSNPQLPAAIDATLAAHKAK